MNALKHKGWHLPRFAQVLCGTMTDRERLGLPNHYVQGRWDAAVSHALAGMLCLSVWDLLCKLKSANTGLAERIAASQILALYGDPRIRVDQPEMVWIPGAQAFIGLPDAQVDTVMFNF